MPTFLKNNLPLVEFEVADFPSFCGGKILHAFDFYERWYELTKDEQKVAATVFKNILIERHPPRHVVSGDTYELDDGLPWTAFLTFAAVVGSSLDVLLSCREYKKSKKVENPNSHNITYVATLARNVE